MFRLRIGYSDRRRWMSKEEEKCLATFIPTATRIEEIGGIAYADFDKYQAIKNAFDVCTRSMILARRMIDPFAIHVTLGKYHTVEDIKSYFSAYGEVFCVSLHKSVHGRYAFVNFMRPDTSLKVLRAGRIHVCKGMFMRVRGKILSAAEPIPLRPYSPARMNDCYND